MTEVFISYREYVARCADNGVFPPRDFRTWFLIKTQF